MDALKYTKKEYTVEAPRGVGNPSVQIPSKPTLYDPVNHIMKPPVKETTIHDGDAGNLTGNKETYTALMDNAKTTTKETTTDKVGLNYLNISQLNNPGGGYENTNMTAKTQQRNFGNSSITGNVGNTSATNAPMDLSAWSNQHNNVKLPISRNGRSCTNEYGCDKLYNGDTVYIDGVNEAYKITVYDNNTIKYLPFV
jgi:hypothetical protein